MNTPNYSTMRIDIATISPELRLTIKGNEPWLERIYADFPVTDGSRPQLSGVLTLRLMEGGSVQIGGELAYAPHVSCSRCAREIAWPLTISVDERFLPTPVNETPQEKTLSKAELDSYYLTDYQVDVEGLINDLVQTELPSLVVPAAVAGGSCGVCHEDLATAHVYGPLGDPGTAPQNPAERSPFAVLKGLKVKN